MKKWVAVNDAIGAGLSGMDYMSPNISEPFGYVIDVNSRPQNDINLAALPRKVGTQRWLPFKPGWKGHGWTRTSKGLKRRMRNSWANVIPCYYRDRCRCHPRKNAEGQWKGAGRRALLSEEEEWYDAVDDDGWRNETQREM